MTITVNGNSRELAASCTLLQFITDKKLEPHKIVVEYNGAIVKEPDWGTIILKENDCLEVLRFVGGG